MNRILVVGVVVAVLFGCENAPSIGVSRSALEQAPDDNILTRAVAQEPVGAGWVMVSESDYLTALRALEKPSSPEWKEEIISALAVASAANESWTSGVVGGVPREGLIEGAKWVALRAS